MAIKILDVGQCGFDGPRMASLWQEQLGATVERVDSGDEAAEQLGKGKFDLVLVNRLLARDSTSGLDVIKELLARDASVPVMLVSDKPDAQEAAVALGAVRGFGKADLGEPATIELVRSVAGGERSGS
jgi:CheY-like chemotaxis protein